ncbi:3-dehydroquinate synthase [Halomonas sp. McH1-25]|uniref:3-dehydroquinate synthase n=1 Tax=unclassified Halomonas TaxID=2609666 RepID=UPI001EF5E386|nr:MULTISPECIES: 3-dehydroquinate synthase [unclassified Halomonas]MCG7602019.1 3-dehydroquinate synthase [Halomonas sp. McH1-25]MCP1344617.1 3-dehydroquinate synthase [Halomonas sp. FL8]MCP1360186.1 3-dehydroquinate synthase [Halomonas sp. BBD45]
MENEFIVETPELTAAATDGFSPRSDQATLDSHATAVKWQRFSVPYAYPVAFTRNLFASDNPLLLEMLAMRERDKRHRCLVYLDEGVVTAQPDLPARVRSYFDAHSQHAELIDWVVVPGGEDIKLHPGHVMAMLKAIHRLGIDRHAYVIAIGGGAVLDAVGFAAATAHRGVRHIRIPTTVLAQNDSGVGVKNAINTHGVKNFTGTFAPPWAVLNDFDFLSTLSRRERVAGIAEAIKVALIRDGDFYRWMEGNALALARFDRATEEFMVRRSAELHMRQIAYGGDPFELGSARPLDFGHWSAHKLEALSHHEVQHGEAVAIGIALDARYSALAGLLSDAEAQRIVELLDTLGLATFHPQLLASGPDGELAILAGLREFREHLGGELTVTLLAGIGQGVEVHAIDTALMAQAIAWLKAREERHALAQ